MTQHVFPLSFGVRETYKSPARFNTVTCQLRKEEICAVTKKKKKEKSLVNSIKVRRQCVLIYKVIYHATVTVQPGNFRPKTCVRIISILWNALLPIPWVSLLDGCSCLIRLRKQRDSLYCQPTWTYYLNLLYLKIITIPTPHTTHSKHHKSKLLMKNLSL